MDIGNSSDRRYATANLLCAYAAGIGRLTPKDLCQYIRSQLDTYKPQHETITHEGRYYESRKGLMGQLHRWWSLPSEFRDPLACDWIANVNGTGVRIDELHRIIRDSWDPDSGRPVWLEYTAMKRPGWQYSGPSFAAAELPKPEDLIRYIDRA